jgi:hypothetical protein
MVSASLYIGFRSQNPEDKTVKDADNALKEYNLNINQFKNRSTDHC